MILLLETRQKKKLLPPSPPPPTDCPDQQEQTRPSVTIVDPAMTVMLTHADISPSLSLGRCCTSAGQEWDGGTPGPKTKLFSVWLSANECSSLPVIPGSCLCFISHLVSLQAGDHELPDLPSGGLLFSACSPTRAPIRQATQDLVKMLDHSGFHSIKRVKCTAVQKFRVTDSFLH